MSFCLEVFAQQTSFYFLFVTFLTPERITYLCIEKLLKQLALINVLTLVW